MIITGGQARGRKVTFPEEGEVRPTSSKIRQAFFNILGARIQEARFLDIFAGSGLMGLEAMSRGAQSVTAIEESRKMVQSIRTSIKTLGFQKDTEVLSGDFRKMLEQLPENGFDIVYADPPYKSPFASTVARLLDQRRLLVSGGVLAVEHVKGYKFPEDLEKLKFIETREYGQTGLSFFEQS